MMLYTNSTSITSFHQVRLVPSFLRSNLDTLVAALADTPSPTQMLHRTRIVLSFQPFAGNKTTKSLKWATFNSLLAELQNFLVTGAAAHLVRCGCFLFVIHVLFDASHAAMVEILAEAVGPTVGSWSCGGSR
jgi:hypothetical protein